MDQEGKYTKKPFNQGTMSKLKKTAKPGTVPVSNKYIRKWLKRHPKHRESVVKDAVKNGKTGYLVTLEQ